MSQAPCIACVPQQNVAVIERCGKFKRFAFPGFNFVWCCLGDCIAGKVSLRIQQLDVKCETKTKDNVFVTLVVSVQYQVAADDSSHSESAEAFRRGDYAALVSFNPAKLYDAFYKLTNSEQQIKSYVFDVIRSTVPKMNLDDVFEGKEQIANSVQGELRKCMNAFGYSIIQTLITDIEPDHKVKTAMNEINAAQRIRMAAVEKAEAEKIRVIKAAEADAEAKYLEGQGIARQRAAIVHGLRDSVMDFSQEVHEVSSRDVVEMMMMTQYFDMLQKVGLADKSTTLFLNHSPSALGDIGTQIRNGVLQADHAKLSMAPTAAPAGQLARR